MEFINEVLDECQYDSRYRKGPYETPAERELALASYSSMSYSDSSCDY